MQKIRKYLFTALLVYSVSAFSADFLTDYSFKTERIHSCTETSYIKVLIAGNINSKNANIYEYFNYSRLKSQLAGSCTFFYSVWYDPLIFREDNKEFIETKSAHLKRFIQKINPDYIILYALNLSNHSSLLKYLENTRKGKYYTIGFNSNEYDINLVLDLTPFSSFLSSVGCTPLGTYFLSTPLNNRFDAFIEKNSIEKVRVTKLADLRNFFSSLSTEGESIVISDLSVLYNEVGGSFISKDQIIKEVPTTGNVFFIDISTDSQYVFPHFLEMDWDFKEVFEYLDAFIISDFYDLSDATSSKIEITSRLNINIGNIYRQDLLTDFDLLELGSFLKFFDGVR